MELRAGLSRERGQSLVVVALMLVVLIGAAALALDVGNLYAQRRFVQNAADAAALAGARMLALDEPFSVDGAVDEYAVRNGAEVVGQTVITDTNSGHVGVTVTKVVPSYFMGVMGVDTSTVAAAAQAGYCPADNLKGVFPFGVAEPYAIPEVNVIVWDSASTIDPRELPPGYDFSTDVMVEAPNRGWINITGGGVPSANTLSDIVKDPDGYDGIVDTGAYSGTVGLKDSLLKDLAAWVEPLLTQEEKDTRDDRALDVLVPIYDYYTVDPVTEAATFHISGFAVMHIYDVVKIAQYKYIWGKFVYRVIVQPQARCGAVDYGARIVQLER